MKHLYQALFLAVFALSATSAMAMEMEGADLNWHGDAWTMFRTVSFDNPVFGSEDSDTAFLFRFRLGASGETGATSWKFTLSTAESSDPYGTRFGTWGASAASVRLQTGYMAYRASENWRILWGRVPNHWLDNDLVFDTGRYRGNDSSTDGVWFSFNFAENTSLYAGWVRLSDTPGNTPKTDGFYGQLNHRFSDAFWVYVGAVGFMPDKATPTEDYSAFFAKASYMFTPEFTLWLHFLGSNGNIDGNPEVSDSDTSAFLVGANYQASDRLWLRATGGTIGGSSVESRAFHSGNYVLRELGIGPSGSADVDATYFNFRLEYATADDATLAIDYTFGDEQDAGPSGNSGSGIILSLDKAFA
ncbi:MAG: hypothetical protein V2G42_06995 [bacterium JZ-2024 1]